MLLIFETIHGGIVFAFVTPVSPQIKKMKMRNHNLSQSSIMRKQRQSDNFSRITATSLALGPTSTLLSSLPQPELMLSNINVLQILSGLCTYIGLIAYYDRPRGKLQIDESSFILKESQVEGAGLGLYVSQSLPKGTQSSNSTFIHQ